MLKHLVILCFLFECLSCNNFSDSYMVPNQETIIIVDRTDPLTTNQQIRILQEINLLKDELRTNDIIAIYEVTGTLEVNFKNPLLIYNQLIPPNGNNCNELTTTCNYVEEDFKNFEDSFSKTIGNIKFDKSSNRSYILESIRMISKTKEFTSVKNKKVVIFSNMLQNSETISHYRNYKSISELQNTSYLLDIDGSLIDTEVQIYMLLDRGDLQTKKLKQWWLDYFNITKATTTTIRTF